MKTLIKNPTPACAGIRSLLAKLIDEYMAKVDWEMMSLPLDRHANVRKATETAEAAREQ